MLIFIDESGDTGLDIDKGATEYFTIVMVIFEEDDEAQACDQRIKLLKKELGLPDDFEFHFHKNSNRIRGSFLKAVLPYQFFYYGIVINKHKLFGEGFRNKESFYKYACGLVFENAKDKLDRATVVIDKSGRKLFKFQLAKYLKNKMNTADNKRIRKIKIQDSQTNNLLQLADMIAGAINRSLVRRSDKDEILFRDIIKAREIYVQIWPK